MKIPFLSIIFLSLLATASAAPNFDRITAVTPYAAPQPTNIDEFSNDIDDIFLFKKTVKVDAYLHPPRLINCSLIPEGSKLAEECKKIGWSVGVDGVVAVVCREFSGTYCAIPASIDEPQDYDIYTSIYLASKEDLLKVD